MRVRGWEAAVPGIRGSVQSLSRSVSEVLGQEGPLIVGFFCMREMEYVSQENSWFLVAFLV